MLLSNLQPFPGTLICLNLPAFQQPQQQSSHSLTILRFWCLLISSLPHRTQSAAPDVTLPFIQTRSSTVSNSWTCKILPTSHPLSLTSAKTRMQTSNLWQRLQIPEQPSSVKTWTLTEPLLDLLLNKAKIRWTLLARSSLVVLLRKAAVTWARYQRALADSKQLQKSRRHQSRSWSFSRNESKVLTRTQQRELIQHKGKLLVSCSILRLSQIHSILDRTRASRAQYRSANHKLQQTISGPRLSLESSNSNSSIRSIAALW